MLFLSTLLSGAFVLHLLSLAFPKQALFSLLKNLEAERELSVLTSPLSQLFEEVLFAGVFFLAQSVDARSCFFGGEWGAVTGY